MARNPRFDVLFEPVRIGPVTAPNRFYQVPHASGMTNALPQVRAAFRGVKAEGGWGVVCTGAVSIHPSSDDSPLPFASLWDDKDIRAHALMTDAVHEHGALAGIELWHGGACALNRARRLAPLWPPRLPRLSPPFGFVGHLRPPAIGTGDAVGDKCGVALRISLEELRGKPGINAPSEAHEAVTLLGEIPDLWDVKMDSSPTDCAPSRFSPEGSHEPVVNFVKQLTKKPVVGVGRFTSPDVMVSQVRRGILDLIGGARPSIADPFLPNKINEGREHEIRECIGCNICISSWHDGVPVRCTQNPTAGAERPRDWHPERFAPPASDSSILIVGGGPAGLECATPLPRRGYSVTIADSANEFGGRLRFETGLPGLKTWGRVVDWRLGQLREKPNVNMYPGSALGVDDILGLEHRHVVVATGARWTKMLFSTLEFPAGVLEGAAVYTPDDLAAGVVPQGPVVVFDFDNYYLAGAVALQLAASVGDVAYVTTAGNASAWAFLPDQHPLVHPALGR